MKNTHILDLRQEVPIELRLETYKEALNYLIANKNTSDPVYGSGLCLVLPCILWGLTDCDDYAPNGMDWLWQHTPIAFPEIKEWVERAKYIREETSVVRQIRIEALQTIITELENNLTNDKDIQTISKR